VPGGFEVTSNATRFTPGTSGWVISRPADDDIGTVVGGDRGIGG
jgi:hypothetical protein